ncbi:hypothetical protein [Pseudovibrio sp. POLY-S9]|uniref:hypothetical protein n=1 Tax=Pseudovibrio sp. POLY-S9 TaxID=1576596 RepID=UPI00070C5F4D|nr:hypothetical protein [Pseudovibrio sp. POLY-S9]
MKTISILMSSILLTVASTGFVVAAGSSNLEENLQIKTPFIVADAGSVREEHKTEKARTCKDYDESSEHGKNHDKDRHDDREEHDVHDGDRGYDDDRDHNDCDDHDDKVQREREHERSSRSHS